VSIITDTLQEKSGKWSIKRVSSFFAFHAAIIYAFLPTIMPSFKPLEFIFWGLMTFAATGILGTVWNKKIDKPNTSNNEN